MQKLSVLVNSSAVLKAPQNNTPPMNPPNVRNPRLRVAAGELRRVQAHNSQRFNRCTRLLAPGGLDAELAHNLEAVLYQWLNIRLRNVTFGAEMPPRRH